MSGAAWFGVWGAVAWFLLIDLAPQPGGAIVYWTACTALLLWGSALCWRRMRLPYATASMAVGAVASVMWGFLAAAGYRFYTFGADPVATMPWEAWVVNGLCVAASAILFMIESRVHRDAWLKWKMYAEGTSAWDAVRGRHIPPLHVSDKNTSI